MTKDKLICWICGFRRSVTWHHAIPKHLHPMMNFKIPLCLKCHRIIHGADSKESANPNTIIHKELTSREVELKGINALLGNKEG